MKGKNNPNWKGGKVEVECEVCGETFKVIPSKEDERRFCSLECMGKQYSEDYSGKQNPNYKGGTFKTCEICGDEFWVLPSDKGKDSGSDCCNRFCSKECRGKWWSKELKKRIKNGDFDQKIPGEDFPHPRGFEGKHHSKETKEKISNIHEGKKPHDKYDQVSKAIQGSNNPTWKGGSSFEPYPYEFNEELKEKVRELYDRTCQLCGKKENGQKLAIHHIDYNKENCDLINLIPLCVPCNGIVNSQREKWTSHFREITSEVLED